MAAGDELTGLADAARSRAEADWLVGINGTRAMTAFNSRDGGFYLTTVGRVQTPTLAVVVEREEKIRRFVPRDYFEVKATFGAKAGQYEGKWFDRNFKKSDDPEHKADRFWTREDAEAIVAACEGKPGTVTEESKPSTQIAPALFDLTTLQREANGRFGFSAKTTLALAQALYEKHKVLTYPRTDSRALPEDYLGTVRQTLGQLSESGVHGEFARTILEKDWVKPNKRVFDNSKISDHFAIIPTLQAPKNLSDAEQKVYDLVVRRFMAVFYPAAEYLVTTRITTVAGHPFKTEGRVLVNPGWLAIYGRDASGGDGPGNLVPVEPNETVQTDEIALQANQTRPPARYTEATLLSAMEGAGKLVDDDELREAMAGKGLGTPATRAAIIEGLITERYLLREGRELIPTAKAFQLLTLQRGLGVAALSMPELTGDRQVFMSDIAAMTRDIVEKARNFEADTVPGDYAVLQTPCPACGGVIKENYKRFACSQCDFSITKIPGGRQFELPEVETLLKDKVIGPLTGFRSKMGRPFSAILKITPENKLEFDFGQNDAQDEQSEPVDFSGQESLGPCPKCQSPVYIHGMHYVCSHAVGPNKTCDFRSGREILQQPIEPAQMQKLLADGRTDLLTGFVSSRTRRKFKAFLVREPSGKIGFEFDNAKGKAAKADGKDGEEGAEDRKRTTRTTAARSGTATKASTTTRKTSAAKATTTRRTTKAAADDPAAAEGESATPKAGAKAASTAGRTRRTAASAKADNTGDHPADPSE